ncbi:MAG TPA: HGGxSTG domain-containing protein, partial [Steroidobacteraceae bacterium]|nr:HGGxSTG domain-containing protein [Steroidobacteraceae bacterium]
RSVDESCANSGHYKPLCACVDRIFVKSVAPVAMPNGRCKLHGGKSTGPRTPEGLERSRRANWKHGHFSREAKAERSRLRAAMLAVRYLRDSI